MVIHEFSLHWTRSHNLVDGPRMRDQSIRISERRLLLARTEGTSTGSGTRSWSHWLYRQPGARVGDFNNALPLKSHCRHPGLGMTHLRG
jgi:hypothetical protein